MDGARVGRLGIDLGKTSCRIRFSFDKETVSARGPGAPGLASGADGMETTLAAIEAVVATLPGLNSPHPGTAPALHRIGAGIAGAESNQKGAVTLANVLAERYKAAEVTVASDAITAHAGALDGEPGTILIAGTGSVALHLDTNGQLRRRDGWGIWLGDRGSGFWIGREGLRRALRAVDGIDAPTALTERAAALVPSLSDLPFHLTRSGTPERTLAAFAPEVIALAAVGDRTAQDIIEEATSHLAETAAACTPPGGAICILGGLSESKAFSGLLDRHLRERGLHPTPPKHDAIDGALLICAQTRLPHERLTVRVRH